MEFDEKTPLLTGKCEKIPSAYERKRKQRASSILSMRQLFRFADKTDRILLILAVFGSAAYGVTIPCQFLLFGEIIDRFVDYIIHENWDISNLPDIESSTTKTASYYVVLAFGSMLSSWMGMGLFALSAERQVHKMRLAMFQKVIYQDVAWFETSSVGKLNTRFTEELHTILDGMGSKLSRIISSITCFVCGYAAGFIFCWDLTFILLASLPLIVTCAIFMTKTSGYFLNKELLAYSKAGHIAEQSISSIKTVAAFGGESCQVQMYAHNLVDACRYAIRKAVCVGIGLAVFQLIIYTDYGVSVWYIIRMAREEARKPGHSLAVFFAVTLGSMLLGQTAATCFQALNSARGAASIVFKTIDETSSIDASSTFGIVPNNIKGNLQFCGVNFAYPKRPDVKVLEDFNLVISSGQCVAIVGESGGGKSTIVKLLQRLYDPDLGYILLDGYPLNTLNVGHLRRHIGVVSQEPSLFTTTISENIAFGNENATQREIEAAAKIANAHDFILRFPKGYDTLCGERGAKMSGGQKQRIAIARALLRNPEILLFDEATSALDSESELAIQDAIDKAGKNRTTIIIAHRLSTVKRADVIVVLNEGKIHEIGKHEQLMKSNGIYQSFIELQENDNEMYEDDEDIDFCHEHFQQMSEGTIKASTIEESSVSLQFPDVDNIQTPSFFKITKLNAPEWKFLLVGCFGAALYGVYPFLSGLAFGEILHAVKYNPKIKEQNEAMADDAKKLLAFYLIIGIESGLGIFLQSWCLSFAGQKLTKRLRTSALSAILRQEVSYFDNPENSTGALCSRLATEVSSIQGATGPQLGLIVSTGVMIISGFIVAFIASWNLTLTMMAFLPVVLIACRFIHGFFRNDEWKEAFVSYTEIVNEYFTNIVTIVSFNCQRECIGKLNKAAELMHRKAKRRCHYVGVLTGTIMAFFDLSLASAVRYGGHLLVEKELTLRNMMTCIFTVVLSAVVIGQIILMTPDYFNAKKAATRLFTLLEKIPSIDSYSDGGKRPSQCFGSLSLANVTFRYPTRRQCKILRNFKLVVESGRNVALVGTSGCGKTTLMSLIERFYDVNAGELMIDGVNVKDLNVKWLRSQMSIISQDPVLFDLTIRDNIAYAVCERQLSEEEIINAAKMANIHDFIMSLPKGYDTLVGGKGSLLSGGQKQKIAIARALARNPKILLLDEATSALDAESEKEVQKALKKASVGRTTITISHRFSFIRNADVIIVMKRGKIVEFGTHSQLLALRGVYFAMYKGQTTTNTQHVVFQQQQSNLSLTCS